MNAPDKNIARTLERLTGAVVENFVLASTPIHKDVTGRELRLDLRKLEDVEFHPAARLLGAMEGFRRRGGIVRVALPPRSATPAEAEELAQPSTRTTDSYLVQRRAQLARSIQSRSRARRFLDRIGFVAAAQAGHIDGSTIDVIETEVAGIDSLPPGIRVEPNPRSDDDELLGVMPFQWFPLTDESAEAKSLEAIRSALASLRAAPSLQDAVVELISNVRQHSLHDDAAIAGKAASHALVAAAVRRSRADLWVELAIVDGGVGVPATLEKAHRKTRGAGSTSEILAFSFEPGSTRKTAVTGITRGLALTRNVLTALNGEVTVRSGTGHVRLAAHGKLQVLEPEHGSQPGTAYAISLPAGLRRPLLNKEGEDESPAKGLFDTRAFVLAGDHEINRLPIVVPAGAIGARALAFFAVTQACDRTLVEKALLAHAMNEAVALFASAEGDSARMLGLVRAACSALPLPPKAAVLVLDGFDAQIVHGDLGPGERRVLTQMVVDLARDAVRIEVDAIVDGTPLEARCTWSLEVAPRWIPPDTLTSNPIVKLLAPFVLAHDAAVSVAAADDLAASQGVLDVIVTDRELVPLAEAIANWLGAKYVRRIPVPQEPDPALLADEIAAVSVVLAPLVHGAGATAPIVRGLLAAGRRLVTVCSLVDARADTSVPMQVAGHDVAVVPISTHWIPPEPDAIQRMEEVGLQRLQEVRHGQGTDLEFFEAVAASPGALALGHFHSPNRAWMSAVVHPTAIANAGTAVGRLIADRLAKQIREELDHFEPTTVVDVRPLAEPTPLVKILHDLLAPATLRDNGPRVVVLVDWGALTGETAVREAAHAAKDLPDGIVVALGVDRAHAGAHRLMNGAMLPVTASKPSELDLGLETVTKTVRVSFLAAVDFPRDHRSEVDCPHCATERSLIALGGVPPASVNSRLRLLRVRTSAEIPPTETLDAFGCPMSGAEVVAFLLWRQILHAGLDDRTLAHGVVLELISPGGMASSQLQALARNLALNPELLRRRPWSSPRFRHALADALGSFLVSGDAMTISSDMARQLVAVLRMSSKSHFARAASVIYAHWTAADVREELEMCAATMLKPNLSDELWRQLDAAASDFLAQWHHEVPLTVGALRANLTKLRLAQGRAGGRYQRWNESRGHLQQLNLHIGIGSVKERLRALAANLQEPQEEARALTYLDGMLDKLHALERFIASTYPRLEALLEPEMSALIQLGVAEPLPNAGEWHADVAELTGLVRAWREAPAQLSTTSVDITTRVDTVLLPLDTARGSKSFPSLVLRMPSDLDEALESLARNTQKVDVMLEKPPGSGAARIFFPDELLKDLLTQLADNANKHRASAESKPLIRLQILTDDGLTVANRLRVGYAGTKQADMPNPRGGLSGAQWGGILATFGATLKILDPDKHETFALEVSFLA